MHVSFNPTKTVEGSSASPAFRSFLDDLMIETFNHSLSSARHALTSAVLLEQTDAKSPSTVVNDPLLVRIDRITRCVLHPLRNLQLDSVVVGFKQLNEHVRLACASVDRHFPGAGPELEAVWVSGVGDPGEWMLDFPLALNSETLHAGLLVEPNSVVTSISEHQRSLLLTPFRKLRRDVGKWLSTWVRARISCEEAEREVKLRLRTELDLHAVELDRKLANITLIDFTLLSK